MKIFLFCLIILSNLVAQPDFRLDTRNIQSGKFFNSEVHYFPAVTGFNVYYSYKISYSQLFFEKKDELFIAGLKVSIDIKDTSGNTIKRAFEEKKISVENFELTNSTDYFLQGLINFNLTDGKYGIVTVISDQTSKRERRIPPVELEISKTNSILNPIILDNSKTNCSNQVVYNLANNSSSIPFNRPQDIMVIPVSDSTIKTITINAKRSDTVLVDSKKITEFIKAEPQIKFCNEKVVLGNLEDSTALKYFVVNNFANSISEGPIQLEVFPDDKSVEKKTFNLNVIWIGKPASLIDPEIAIKLLEIIEPKSVVSEILSKSGDDNYNLYEYWKAKDPTPKTNYNELMNEFYSRVDYCDEEFRTISGNGGAKSDRGKIYIKFGAPDSINRDTNSEDKIVETWIYEKTNKKFLFIDKDGTGKFLLAESK